MKRFLVSFVTLLLLFSVFVSAGAETEELTIYARDMGLNKYTGTFYYRAQDSYYYQIIDAEGNILSDENAQYTSVYPRDSFYKVEVKTEDGVHDEGLLDGYGKVLVPAEYADINIISDRWQAGIKLTPSSADDKDYTFSNWNTGEKTFYQIDTVDIFFDGQKVGSLERSEYGTGYATAYNAYICFTDMEQRKTFYNSRMEKSPYKSEYTGEYEEQYQKGVSTYIHQGSGQTAFVASCTLNPDDLQKPYLYDRGDFLDIQGNLLFKTVQVYDYVKTIGNGYALVQRDRKKGLIDLKGNEIIPPVYDDLSNYEDNLLQYGYISATKDGKFGFLDANGNETTPFVYSSDIVSNKTTFATIKNLDGTIIVLTGAVGELTEHFADVSFPGYYGCMAFVGQNENKQYCVVDLYGNTLLPYKDGYRNIELTLDGTIALVSYGSQEYGIFRFGKPDISSAAPSAPDETGEADDGTWTCENGHSGNTGKFCTECGSAKPVEEEPLTHCPSCGYEFGETVPNFCTECGTKLK